MSEVLEQYKIGQQAPEFQKLLGVDGHRYSLSSFDDKPFLVIVFTYNGCPTVKVEEERIKALQESYAPKGVQFVKNNTTFHISRTKMEVWHENLVRRTHLTSSYSTTRARCVIRAAWMIRVSLRGRRTATWRAL